MNKGDMIAHRNAFGQALIDLADTYPKMVVFDADVSASTQTIHFKNKHPERFYEMGIAEANMVGAAAGMALCGFTPWVSTFAVFLAKRALDQVRVSVAHANLPVKLNASYGGLPTGRAGATHSSVEDLAIMRAMPNMTVLTPADAVETIAMVDLAMAVDGPVYLRTVRCEVPVIFDESWRPVIGKAAHLAEGSDVAICSEGMMTPRALAAVDLLAARGIKARLLHFGTIKPFDTEAVIEASRDCGAILTVENHSVIGGLGGAVSEALADEGMQCMVKRLGFPDIFMESGDDNQIFSSFGLDAEGIARAAEELLALKRQRN